MYTCFNIYFVNIYSFYITLKSDFIHLLKIINIEQASDLFKTLFCFMQLFNLF